jgi:uncharacterized protein (DUF1330 family)
MSVLILAQINIHDRARYQQYQDGFKAVFAKFNGQLLAVDEQPSVIEGEWPSTRTVVIRFPCAEEAKRWYQSPEYQAIATHRYAASKANVVVVEELSQV